MSSPKVRVNHFLPGVYKWHTNIPTYAKVMYRNVYRGIDLIFHGEQGNLEYDWVVNPGANPAAIRIAVSGRRMVHLDGEGNLVLESAGGVLMQERRMAYQEFPGGRRVIPARYVLSASYRLGVQLGIYDPTKLLIIDPVLRYGITLGGTQGQEGWGIAVDALGNAYVTGRTQSPDFPTKHALRARFAGGAEAFAAKLSRDGSRLLYSTYLGGSEAADDRGNGIAVDAVGNAYVTGETTSRDFPTKHAAQAALGGNLGYHDAFVTKIAPDGSHLLYSTYLGGGGDDSGAGIAVDRSGSAYVAGWTASADFPTVHAFQPAYGHGIVNAFVTKLSPDGSEFVYSTYLGGSGADWGSGIAVDALGEAYVTGRTASRDFPIEHPIQAAHNPAFEFDDAFVSKLTPDGTKLVYSTYLGGSSVDQGNGIAVDALGNAYVTGRTGSSDFPTKQSLQPTSAGRSLPAFVTKLSPDGSQFLYSTYLYIPGSEVAQGSGIVVDASGDAYVTGQTSDLLGNTVRAFVAEISDNPTSITTPTAPTSTALPSGPSAPTVTSTQTSLGSWSRVAPMPTPRWGLAAATGPNGRIYAIGGVDGCCNYLSTVEAYDPSTNTWTKVASLPTRRGRLAAAVGSDGRIYAIGGTPDSGSLLSTVEAYDPATDTWSTEAPMPTGRDWLAAATGPNGRIYAIGGTAVMGGHNADFAAVEAYDTSTDTWSPVAPMPTGRYLLAAATGSDGRIYAIGGFTESGGNYFPVGTVEAYNSTTSPTATATASPSPTPSPLPTSTPTPTPRVVAVSQVSSVPGIPGAAIASFTVSFSSTAPGQGEVYFGSGPGCQGLVEVATRDLHPGSTQHTVLVTGNDFPGTVGNNGILPGATYWFEVVTITSGGAEVDDNEGKCYTVVIPRA